MLERAQAGPRTLVACRLASFYALLTSQVVRRRQAEGEVYFSSEGCTQGDPLGPFLFATGYHWQLLEVQAMLTNSITCM